MHRHFPGYHSCSQPQGTLLAKTWKGPSLLGILSGCSHRQGDGPVPPTPSRPSPPAPLFPERSCLSGKQKINQQSPPPCAHLVGRRHEDEVQKGGVWPTWKGTEPSRSFLKFS